VTLDASALEERVVHDRRGGIGLPLSVDRARAVYRRRSTITTIPPTTATPAARPAR
jgi:hypothetical protein